MALYTAFRMLLEAHRGEPWASGEDLTYPPARCVS